MTQNCQLSRSGRRPSAFGCGILFRSRIFLLLMVPIMGCASLSERVERFKTGESKQYIQSELWSPFRDLGDTVIYKASSDDYCSLFFKDSIYTGEHTCGSAPFMQPKRLLTGHEFCTKFLSRYKDYDDCRADYAARKTRIEQQEQQNANINRKQAQDEHDSNARFIDSMVKAGKAANYAPPRPAPTTTDCYTDPGPGGQTHCTTQ